MIVSPPTPGVHQDEWFQTRPAKSQFQLVTTFVIVSMKDEDLLAYPFVRIVGNCKSTSGLPKITGQSV